MPVVTEYAPGAPCWFELATTNQDAAKKFYTEVFGWSVNEYPIGPNQTYTMFKLNGQDVGAAYTLDKHMVDQGIPPHWNVYFAMPNVDEAPAKVTEMGGSVVQKPFDVMDVGRMGIFQDPGGATFFAWQAKAHKGAGLMGEDNAVCWSELMTWDAPQARDFYTGLFGWQTKGAANMASYIEFSVGGIPRGGLLPMEPEWKGMPSNWGIYFQVADCDVTVEKAKSLGAQVRMAPFTAPGVGRLAAMGDPQNAGFSVITLERR